MSLAFVTMLLLGRTNCGLADEGLMVTGMIAMNMCMLCEEERERCYVSVISVYFRDTAVVVANPTGPLANLARISAMVYCKVVLSSTISVRFISVCTMMAKG